jgi:hypothetical protein
MLARLLSSTSQSVPGWLEEYMGHLYERYKPPDKYMPLDGAPATAANVYARMLEVGSHKNKLNRKALHYLLRACNTPSDLEVILRRRKYYILLDGFLSGEFSLRLTRLGFHLFHAF